MKTRVILDTSPLVALINKRDNYHEWSKQQWAMIKPPLLTCEAVITESFFLLRNTHGGQETILKLLERRVIIIDFDLEKELIEIQRLLTIYKSVPVSLADACLVRMAELQSNSSVFTLDSDFQIYRKNRHEIIDIIIPNSL
jgi:uncharacterized protein